MTKIIEQVGVMRRQFEFVDYKVNANEKNKLIKKHKKLALQYFQVDFETYYDCEFNFLDDEGFLKSCNRVVFGAHGPYIEFQPHQLKVALQLHKDQMWRLEPKYNVKYYQYTPMHRDEKIYYQVKPVKYADYKIEKYYIDLYSTKPKI